MKIALIDTGVDKRTCKRQIKGDKRVPWNRVL